MPDTIGCGMPLTVNGFGQTACIRFSTRMAMHIDKKIGKAHGSSGCLPYPLILQFCVLLLKWEKSEKKFGKNGNIS